MNRTLIVTADDMGLHRGMNDGVVRAHRGGIVTACSLVAVGREFDHAVELLRDTPKLEVGAHLTWVAERSLSGMRFAANWRTFLLREPAIDLGALDRELRLQIEKVLATGLRVTHLNSHQHLHVLPRIAPLVHRLAVEFGIPYVRTPYDFGARQRRGAMTILNAFARRARFRGNDRAIGIGDAGALTSARVIDLLAFVEGVTEMIAHPGIGTKDLARTYAWGFDWESETGALCDPAVRDAIARRGITLSRPSEVIT